MMAVKFVENFYKSDILLKMIAISVVYLLHYYDEEITIHTIFYGLFFNVG